MLDVVLDTLFDSVKMIPFLFLSYVLIEFIEHKSSQKMNRALRSSGKYGPVAGAMLGTLPQCGFSVTAASLFSGRVITLGTMIAVFLATSDEAIPVMLSSPESIPQLITILAVKFVIAILAGILIDLVLKNHERKHPKKQETTEDHIHEMCDHDHCDCEHDGIIVSSLKHTIHVFLFIVIVAFILNTLIFWIGEENLSRVLMTGSIFQPFIAGLIGLIPNCAASVILTQLYLAGNISFASIITGLCAGAGIGLVVLFKENKSMKQNFAILGLLYGIGVIAGIIIELIMMLV